MKKNGNNGVFLLLGLGLIGAAGAFTVARGGVSLPGIMPGGNAATPDPAATDDTTGGNLFGVRYPRISDRWTGGLLVTSGGGTRTPTMSSDPTPTTGTNADVSIYGPSISQKWGNYQ